MAVRRPMTLESLLLKPYFWRRPSQLIRRMLYVVRPWPNPPLVELPWGLTLECYPGELIGESVMRTGVFEMTTTEALVRLVDPAELVLDVGANVGYMTSLLARAAGPGGRVIAYEPNPAVFQRLATNVDAWHEDRLAAIEPRQAAVSDCDGIAPMTIPQGASECAAMGDRPIERAGDVAHVTVQVQTVTLDSELADEHVGVLKLDVEDHEVAALRGAQTLLEKGRIRDILFEDHNSYPSETTRTLEHNGYSVFDLASRPLGVALHDPKVRTAHASWDAPMRLATLDATRAQRRVSTPGWLSLGDPRRWHSHNGRRDKTHRRDGR